MATTEQWIEWSRRFAQPYWRQNHQMFLEVAMAACRHYRDSRGMSRDQALACAEHYWYARWMCFAVAGGAGDLAGTPGEVFSPTLGTVMGRIGSGIGFVGMAAVTTILAALWDVVKRILFALGAERMIPGGREPASRPSGAQLEWACRGWMDGATLDLPYADQMRWRFMIMDIPGTLRVPPPPI
jgi:hypothetical protein